MEETRAFAVCDGREPSEKADDRWLKPTQWWAAAVRLATVSFRDRADAVVCAAGVTGLQRQIDGNLLNQLPPPLFDAALDTKRLPEHMPAPSLAERTW